MATLSLRPSGNLVAAALIVAGALSAFAAGWISDPAAPLGNVAQATRNDWRDLAARGDDPSRDLAVLEQ
ncbi:MAG: hypothetical protein ACT7A5_30395, partial [Ferrovibrionaceae bacterium]